MSVLPPRASSLTARLAAHAWWMLLLGALGVFWLATERRIARVEALTDSPTWSVDAPQRDAFSQTGYERGQRKLIVPGHHDPSYMWIREAQLSAEQGSLRLRHIGYDAPPDGRAISRTAPYRWWLVTIGLLQGAVSGEPLGYAIERGALVADPLLFALLLTVGAAYSARFLGPLAAGGFVVGGISLFPLAVNFLPGAPDPHSLAWVLALGSILPLLASPPGGATSRRFHAVVAGVFGGLGLWNDATTQAPVLLAVCLGALGHEYVRTRGPGLPPAHFSWRSWAWTGALTALAASLYEFAPDHFAWSLGSVHPLHAVIWWGLGEVLHAAGIWFRSGRPGFGRGSLALLGVAGLAVAAWPVAGIWSDSGALLAGDFHASELANHPGGGIAPNLAVWLHRAGDGAKWTTVLPALLILVLLGRIFMVRNDREELGRLVFLLLASLFVFVLACMQLRWWNLFDVIVLAALAALLSGNDAGTIRTRGWSLIAGLLVLPGLWAGFPPALRGKEVTDLSQLEAQALIERDFAYWLAKRGGAQPTILFSSPIFSGAASYYGGFAVVVSSDSEHQAGYLTAVRIASAVTEQETAILVNGQGITHLAIPVWDPVWDQLVRIGMNVPPDQPMPSNSLLNALREWAFPAWMRPLDYLIPNQPDFQGFELRAYAVQAEQEPELVLSRLADFFLERGQQREALAVRESLKAYPRSVVALGVMANLDFALRDGARLKESLDALIPQLSRRAARNLPADRRISLATLLLQTKHTELAREQMTACFEGLDAGTLRSMTPSSVVNLVAISRSLGIPFPDKDLQAVAMELIPPAVRAQLK